MHKPISKIIVLWLGLVSVPATVQAEPALSIVQRPYSYRYEYAQGPVAQTFVISKTAPYQGLIKAYTPELAITTRTGSTMRSMQEVVYFAKGSAELTNKATDILDTVDIDTPVSITGYTCPLGPAEINRRLAQKRAFAVADYLRSRGLTVNTVKGKGGCSFVNCDLKKNRRVIVKRQTLTKKEESEQNESN